MNIYIYICKYIFIYMYIYTYICIYTLYVHIDYELSRTPKTIFNMDQVNTILSKKGLSPIEAFVFFCEFLLRQNASHCSLYGEFPSLCASGVGLQFFLGAESFSGSLPAHKLQPCLWKQAEAAYAAAVLEEAYASGLHMDHHGRYGVLSDIDFDLSPLHTYFRRQHLK